MKKHEVLKKYFGYDRFREGQEAIIDHILDGNDTLGIMPTGAGKSICYQIPAMLLDGITLVISPLISLMKDQVGALNEVGIRAAFLNSSLTYPQYRKALQNAKDGIYKIIYVAPERLVTEEFLEFVAHVKIAMVCVDEAHCVSQWGQDFRPNYLKITEFIKLMETRPIVSAFTATATLEVREDIKKILEMNSPFELLTGFNRENLYFSVQKPKNKYASVSAYIKENPQKSGIIYCTTRKLVEEVCSQLQAEGVLATRYHAGLSDGERKHNQDDFIYDRSPIMVATNAFGMGIDKSNVSFVIHYNMPKNMESYYQEAGRGGRDGKPADCILLYGGQDVILNQFLIDQGYVNEDTDPSIVEAIKQKDRERLKSMTFYCSINTCLRDYMLRYFGEHGEAYCGNCSNCLTQFEEADITNETNIILECVRDCHERYGMNVIMDTLRGSKNAKILQYQMDKNVAYGKLASCSTAKLRQIIHHLVIQHILYQTDDKYTVLKIDTQASECTQGKTLRMKMAKDKEVEPMHKKKTSSIKDLDMDLYTALREKRTMLASAAGVPPYIIFSDKALQDMCEKRPTNKAEMLTVSGVGEVKFERYGEAFLSVFRDFLTIK